MPVISLFHLVFIFVSTSIPDQAGESASAANLTVAVVVVYPGPHQIHLQLSDFPENVETCIMVVFVSLF